MPTTLDLAQRYVALGLWSAAQAAYERAKAAQAPGEIQASLGLAELALARGNARAAIKHASECVQRDGSNFAGRLLLGRAQLRDRELAGARRTFAMILDAASAGPAQRAAAHLGLAHAAAVSGDVAGARANASAAFEQATLMPEPDLELSQEVCAKAVGLGIGAELSGREPKDPAKAPSHSTLAALLAVAMLDHGDGAPAAAVHLRGLHDAEERSAALRLILAEARLRHGGGQAAIDTLVGAVADPNLRSQERARGWFALATAFAAGGAAERGRAEEAYRQGLALRPTDAAARTRLALLLSERGDPTGAICALEQAIRIDPSLGGGWRQAARILESALGMTSGGPSAELADAVVRIIEASAPGVGSFVDQVAPRLVAAAAEVARDEILAGVCAHGHRVKNLLGVIGSRTRSARKLAEGDAEVRLRELERDVNELYEEWTRYLRSMQFQRPTAETVQLAELIAAAVTAAREKADIPITVDVAPGLPEVRGDRVLLGEALFNIISNAAEACRTSPHASVSVEASARSGEGATEVEIRVADTGVGIPRAHLSRVFAPGYTTKATGSGLGLTMAERIVSAHQGRLTVDSTEGQGTRVTILLPTGLLAVAMLSLSPEGPA